MGSLRHFFFYMAVAALSGLTLGIAERIWGWSPGVTFGLALAAITIIGMIATREVLFAPRKPPDGPSDTSPQRR